MSLSLTVIGFPPPPWRLLAMAAGGEKRPGPTAPAERGRVEHDDDEPSPQRTAAAGGAGPAGRILSSQIATLTE